MAICPICNQPCGLVKAHPQCEAELAAGKSAETIRHENEQSVNQPSSALIRSSAKALKTCAAILAPVLILTFGLVGFSAGRDETSVLLAVFGSVVGGLIAASFYNFCVLAGAAALRISEHVEKSEK